MRPIFPMAKICPARRSPNGSSRLERMSPPKFSRSMVAPYSSGWVTCFLRVDPLFVLGCSPSFLMAPRHLVDTFFPSLYS